VGKSVISPRIMSFLFRLSVVLYYLYATASWGAGGSLRLDMLRCSAMPQSQNGFFLGTNQSPRTKTSTKSVFYLFPEGYTWVGDS
jgi:hypothetical protein